MTMPVASKTAAAPRPQAPKSQAATATPKAATQSAPKAQPATAAVTKAPVNPADQAASRQQSVGQEQQVKQQVENQTRAEQSVRAANAPRAGIANAQSGSGTQADQNTAAEQRRTDAVQTTPNAQNPDASRASNVDDGSGNPGTLHMPTADGTSRYNLNGGANGIGRESQTSVARSTGNGRTVDSTTRTTTTNTVAESTTQQTRDASARNQAGQSVQSTAENASIENRRTGERLADNQRVSVDSTGRTTGTEQTTHTGPQSASSRASRALNGATNVGAVSDTPIAGDQNWRGVGTVGTNPRSMADVTGAAGEAHVLAVQAQASAGGSANFRTGQVNAGANGSVRADLVGASGRAQVGTTSSAAGAGFVEGEANIGARAQGNAGIGVDLRNGTANAGVGVDGFAGAEIRGSAGYENRWGGVATTARGQAGIGGAAGASVGITNGRIHARADLGATVGLGGRITVDVNVNAVAIAQDTYRTADHVVRNYNPVAIGSRLGDGIGRWWYGN